MGTQGRVAGQDTGILTGLQIGRPLPNRKSGASRGVKLLLVAVLALSMSLLALFVDSLTAERRANVERAQRELSTQTIGRYVPLVPTYQSVERSLKYAPLFLGLVFLSYFLFEVTAKKPMHLAQYVLVGAAQLIFYLLLLSFAEHLGFDGGFLLGGAATVGLLSVNAGWVFRSVRQRWRALGIFGALYAIIYGLLRLQDNALLLGAVCSFAAVAAAMYWTRELDWYSTGEPGVAPSAAGAPLAGA